MSAPGLRNGLLIAACAAVLACTASGPRPAWELPPPPPRAAPIVQPGAFERTQLDNGLVLMVLEDHGLPRVSLGVTVRRGAGGVDVSQAGLAQYTAELMRRGAGSRDALALARAVDEIGASLAVSSSWDSTTVLVSGLSRDLDRLAEVLADVVLRPRFEEAEAEKARAEQLAGLEQAKDEPEVLAGWHAARAVFGAHRYGAPLEGSAQTVAGFDAAAARAMHARLFVPDDAIVFAAGDIEAADWRARVEAAFAGWQRGASGADGQGAAPSLPAPPGRRVVVVDRPELDQARIIVAHDGIARNDERRIAASLMNAVLGGSGFSARLMRRLRSEEGLTYSVWSGFGMRHYPGPFLAETFTRVPEVRRALDLLLEELERIGSNPPSSDELAHAKSFVVGSFALSLETSGAVLARLVDLEVYRLPQDSLDTYRERVRAVDEAQVAAVARELVQPERAALVVLGPAAALVPQLEGLGEIEVVQP